MLVKVGFSLVGVYPRMGDLLQVRLSSELNPLVEVKRESGPEPADAHRLVIHALAEVEPPQTLAREFDGIARGVLKPAVLHTMIGANAEPDPLVDYCTTISQTLSEACRTSFGLLRWRLGADSPLHPFAALLGSFSLDGGGTWHTLPRRTYVEVRQPVGVSLDEVAAARVESLLQSQSMEPISHALLREAFGSEQGSTRSALVIGIAAAETGLKQLVSTLVPQTQWLIERLPSPPLTKMLKDYLPSMPARCTHNGSVFPPPKYVRSLLHEGVEARNKAVHAGTSPMSAPDVSRLLVVIRDLLYLFDFYAGHEWALDLISSEFRAGLGT